MVLDTLVEMRNLETKKKHPQHYLIFYCFFCLGMVQILIMKIGIIGVITKCLFYVQKTVRGVNFFQFVNICFTSIATLFLFVCVWASFTENFIFGSTIIKNLTNSFHPGSTIIQKFNVLCFPKIVLNQNI